MKTETQTSAERSQLCKLIDGLHVAMLTQWDGEGAMVSRPMSPLEMDAQGALWFFTDLRSSKLEHLRVLNLSFSDTQHSTFVSISGRGEIDVDRSRIERLWSPLARPWFPDGPTSAHLALLKFVPESADLWDAPNSRMVRLFAMAASVVAAQPIGLGQHDRLTDLAAS